MRQSEAARLRNRSQRSQVRTWTKKLEQAVKDNDRALAEKYFRAAVSRLDKSLKKGVYHKNTVARKKSRCARLLQKLAS